jgi:hypothetical protein
MFGAFGQAGGGEEGDVLSGGLLVDQDLDIAGGHGRSRHWSQRKVKRDGDRSG